MPELPDRSDPAEPSESEDDRAFVDALADDLLAWLDETEGPYPPLDP